MKSNDNNLYLIKNRLSILKENSSFKLINQSKDKLNKISSELFINFSKLIEESLKEIDQYKYKFNIISNNNINQIKQYHSIEFPDKPNIPLELNGKINQNHSIIQSNINQNHGLISNIN